MSPLRSEPKGVCVYCRKFVQRDEKAAYAVTGYVLERSQGGANQIHHPTRADGWICHARHAHDCFDRWIEGQDSQGEQQRLV